MSATNLKGKGKFRYLLTLPGQFILLLSLPLYSCLQLALPLLQLRNDITSSHLQNGQAVTRQPGPAPAALRS